VALQKGLPSEGFEVSSKPTPDSQPQPSDNASRKPERFKLSIRTSMLSEFRSAQGVLRAFELGREYVTLGALCAALEQMDGVAFENRKPSLWSNSPVRFTYKGRLYEIAVPFADVWLGPVEPDVAYPETEDLLVYVKRNILATRRIRFRSRFV
jgi:hypothetical protein